MIVAAVAHVAVIRTADHPHRLVQTEREDGLSRHPYCATSRSHLRASPGSRSSGGANYGSLSSARNRADNRTQQSTASHKLTGAPVIADALALGNSCLRIDSITTAAHVNGFEIHSPIVTAYVATDQFGMRALWYRTISVLVEHISSHRAAEDAPVTGVLKIDTPIGANFDIGSCKEACSIWP